MADPKRLCMRAALVTAALQEAASGQEVGSHGQAVSARRVEPFASCVSFLSGGDPVRRVLQRTNGIRW